MTLVLLDTVRRRGKGAMLWALGLLALVALLVVAYPTVRDNKELDSTFGDLPAGVQQLLGLAGGTGLTSPSGYLNSQYFANLLPVLLMVFAIGLAAWAIAGDEQSGGLELLLANPLRRRDLALARAAAMTLLVAALTAVSLIALVVGAAPVGLDEGLPVSRIVAATIAAALLALTFGALAFAVGAITASRSAAIGVATALAAGGYIVEGLAAQVTALQPIRAVMPWHWLIDSDPLGQGLTLQSGVLPLVVSVALVAVGTWRFARRDLH